MNRHHRGALGALTLIVATLTACGETVTIIECPLGTRPEGSECVPWDEGGGGQVDADATLNTGDAGSGADGSPFPTLDTTSTGGDAGAGGVGDTALDATEPVGPEVADGPDEGKVGAPCKLNSECDGGTCLDMPGGYCTFLDCELAGCPHGAACVDLPGGNTGCFATCTGDGDCRAGDQACKTLQAPDDTAVEVCHGVAQDAGDVGALCEGDVDCAGATLCFSTMPGGYCSISPCVAGGCPSGSTCVELGATSMCLRTCDTDEQCDGVVGAERRCSPVSAVAGDVVSVCISGVSGQPVGASCSSDFDCASATCQVLGHGRCSQTSKPCDPAAPEVACSQVEACLDQGQGAIGRCTQPCGSELACPGGSFCVGDAGGTGLCRPPCSGLGASDDCATEDGFTCGFGFALGDTQAQGRYLCDLPLTSDIGASCAADEACDGGTCGSGACTVPCAADLYCPFPGVCVTTAPATCRKACLSSADCPAGTSCTTQAGALGSFCQ